MTPAEGPWTARLRVVRPSAASADRLARALAPEAAREVPRARSRLLRPAPAEVELVVEAKDTGALRAALNTYLGWVQLATATERVAVGGAASEALI